MNARLILNKDHGVPLNKYEGVNEASSDTTDMYALMVKGMKAVPRSSKQKDIIKQINVIRKKMGMPLMKEAAELAMEAKSATGYELYHKDFSSAMQHAYDHAKKKGVIVDKKEIDDKVATGPKKPSKGKTNRYELKAGKRTVMIQVANLDNKRYELNMYIEGKEELSTFSTYITEGRSKASADDYAATPKDLARHKNLLKGLIDAQRKHYTEQEIKSIARKYKQNVATAVGGKDFEDWPGEWIITLMNGIELTYDYNSNTTTIKGWKFDKKKAAIHLAKYGSERDTVRDMKEVGGRKKTVQAHGFEAAFDMMFGRVGSGLFEEAPANKTGVNVVGTGDDPTVWVKKKKRKNAKVETEMFGGQKVFVVTPQRYFDSRLGKSRYTRYEKYVGNDKLGEAIRQYGRNNPKNSIILKNSGNGAMLYLKYGRK
jgi:hypothetical protein